MNDLNATVTLRDDALDVAVHDELPESVAVFTALDARTRNRLAADAWRIGLRAMSVAHAKAEEAKLSDVGRTLLADVEHHLGAHLAAQERGLAEALRQYFDPTDGRLAERLDAAVGDRGALAGMLQRFVGPTSVLAETLARHVGSESAIFKRLSPTDSEGLIKQLEARIGDVLARQQRDLASALDPLVPDGAVAKLVAQLRAEVTAEGRAQAERLQAALRALDTSDEQSALSRMMREAAAANAKLLGALNPRDPGSPLAALDATVKELFDRQATGLAQFQAEVRERQESFDKSVREALGRLEARRQAEARAPEGGRVFEAALTAFVSERLRNAPIAIEDTTVAAGVRGCKKGDLVLRQTAEGAFAGAALVIEAKHDRSYTVTRALTELDQARANRGASAGLMVMAVSHATASFPRFARYGQNVLVCWDPDDPATDPWLEAGLTLGLYLVSRVRASEAGDLAALRDVERRIAVELQRVAKLETFNDKIQAGSEGIAAELRKAKKDLTTLLDKAKATLRALDVALDEEVERQSPLLITPMSDSGELIQ
jgi:hypothetical protein